MTPRELLPPALSDVEGIERALLFGSFAEGAVRNDSDVDVLVVGAPINRRALAARCLTVARLLDRDVNPVVLSPTEWQQMQSDRHPFAL